MLLDLALPDASGLGVLRTIRTADGIGARFNPQLPIIVLTACGDGSERVRSLDMGADDYVQKPFLYEEARGAISYARVSGFITSPR
jgi:DNA-binding response OmpR family regulator